MENEELTREFPLNYLPNVSNFSQLRSQARECLLERLLVMIIALGGWIEDASHINDDVALIQQLLVASSQNFVRMKIGMFGKDITSENLIAMERSRVSSDGVRCHRNLRLLCSVFGHFIAFNYSEICEIK